MSAEGEIQQNYFADKSLRQKDRDDNRTAEKQAVCFA